MTDKEIVERAKKAEKRTGFGELVHSPISKGVNSAFGIGFIEGMVEYRNSLQEEPVSEELDDAAYKFVMDNFGNPKEPLYKFDQRCFRAGAKWQKQKEYTCYEEAFEDGAKWKVENLWKPADGDDLPEIDREVIAILDNGKVGFAHRPNPNGWDGKSLTTGEVEHYTPKTYGKGGWNIPDVKFWLDCLMPKEIEL